MSKISRRQAITGAAVPFSVMGARTALGSEANSAVSFGVIGTGGRGRYVGNYMIADKRARLAAICDIFPDRIDLAKTHMPGADKSKTYRDYKELLADPSIDAVLIATPVYLHPEHFEASVAAKKHIYCEKPAGADVAGVKRLLAASKRADPAKVVQFGFQQRFSPEYLAAEKRLLSGEMGDLTLMMSYWVWGGNAFRKVAPSPYPDEERMVRHWGANKSTSGDFIVEQDCHGLDVLNWFARALPLTAVGDGGRMARTSGDNTDHANVIYEYPGGLKGWLLGTQLPPNPYWDVKEQFFGTKAVIETTRHYYTWFEAGKKDVAKYTSAREITIDAIEHFYGAIVEGRRFNMAADACTSTFTSLLGRMACETKRKVSWQEMLESA
jgi:myo-inositol 2-dehydrogenase/D-chiro-inositol 1-dehydrogenase